ncbi:MAG: dienelactone hydrolase family protein [Acidobacteriota bacterium]|nr:dienelactone hydrolase family protein [Acidobacteriota bacterium]
MLFNGPEDAAVRLILAHGAGAPMDSPFMNIVAEGIGAAGIRVARFEFPYMARRRTDGKKGGPDRAPVLETTWRQAVEGMGGPENLFIGGKSMGGRIASMIADQVGAAGLICMGYPFHPPGKPEKLRTEHLKNLKTPTLILQGARDPFGKPEEVDTYDLADTIRVHWLEDGDHGLKPRKKSGRTEEQNLNEAVAEAVSFMRS